MERRADVIIEYERPEGIRLWVPGQTNYVTVAEAGLAEAIVSTTTKREIAVVLMGKPMIHAFRGPQLCAKVDQIEAVVRAQGFARVVFQLLIETGPPIYRE